MKKNQIMSLMMALTMAGTIAFTSIGVNAAGLTQAESPEQVTYGTVSEDDIAILKSLFDAEYYLEQNKDLISTIGTDFDKLFEHFCKCGVFEGRSCNPNFDPSAYASAYSDLKDVFGTDILQYYKHYATVGQTENRTITTMEAAAKAGITVHPLNNEQVSITPQIYIRAKVLGVTSIKDVATIAQAHAAAVANDAAIVIVPKSDAAFEKAKNLETVGEISLGDNMTNVYVIAIYKGKSGYAAYHTGNIVYDNMGQRVESSSDAVTVDSVPIYKTEDFVAWTREDLPEYKQETGELSYDTFMADLDVQLNHSVHKNGDPNGASNDEPHYVYENEQGTFPNKGIRTDVSSSTNNNHGFVTVESEGSNIYSGDWTMDGYFTDENGNWKTFDSAEEKYEYLQRNTTTVTDEYGNVRATSWYPEEDHPKIASDQVGTGDTVYNIGLDMQTTEDGELTVTVGFSNEEDNYGYVETLEWRENVHEIQE